MLSNLELRDLDSGKVIDLKVEILYPVFVSLTSSSPKDYLHECVYDFNCKHTQ